MTVNWMLHKGKSGELKTPFQIGGKDGAEGFQKSEAQQVYQMKHHMENVYNMSKYIYPSSK